MNGAPSSMVSPGLWGFLAFFLLGLALYLLMRNMNARMRRMSYRSEELAREAEQERAAESARTRGERGDQGTGRSGRGAQAVDGHRRGDVVHGEGRHGQRVEDLVEPEPPR